MDVTDSFRAAVIISIKAQAKEASQEKFIILKIHRIHSLIDQEFMLEPLHGKQQLSIVTSTNRLRCHGISETQNMNRYFIC
jgi:hypothetical protein